MAAPKGNKFWLARSSHGRKTKFTPETLWKGCLEYIEWCDANPLYEEKVFHNNGTITRTEVAKMRAMTIGGLCLFLDIDETTWWSYREEQTKDFSLVVTRTERAIRNQKFAGAAAEMLNPNIIARDLGLSDKRETEHSGNVSFKTIYEDEK